MMIRHWQVCLRIAVVVRQRSLLSVSRCVLRLPSRRIPSSLVRCTYAMPVLMVHSSSWPNYLETLLLTIAECCRLSVPTIDVGRRRDSTTSRFPVCSWSCMLCKSACTYSKVGFLCTRSLRGRRHEHLAF